MNLYLGADFGTSGCRIVMIDDNEKPVFQATAPYPDSCFIAQDRQKPADWWSSFDTLMLQAAKESDTGKIKRICIDGTATTVLACTHGGEAISEALMYNNQGCTDESKEIAATLSINALPLKLGATSSLAKAMHLQKTFPGSHTIHQTDWILGNLTGDYLRTDMNNALKLGFNTLENYWPAEVQSIYSQASSTRVQSPGDPIGTVKKSLCERWGLDHETLACAGTTDSTSAFIATGCRLPGEASTCLGSTLVLKILGTEPVFADEFGIYSHRLGRYWLIGGASNSGGNVIKASFSDDEIIRCTQAMQPEQPTGLHYYPLTGVGERFPYADPDKQPVMEPVPEDRCMFFQAILEGITEIEALGYEKLAQKGAPAPGKILTTGGGSVNQHWQKMRANRMNVNVSIAAHTEAAYGAALLAKNATTNFY